MGGEGDALLGASTSGREKRVPPPRLPKLKKTSSLRCYFMHSGNVGIENVKAWNDFYQFPSQMNAWRWGGREPTALLEARRKSSMKINPKFPPKCDQNLFSPSDIYKFWHWQVTRMKFLIDCWQLFVAYLMSFVWFQPAKSKACGKERGWVVGTTVQG